MIEDPRELCGAVGVACMRSKMVFKDAQIALSGHIVRRRRSQDRKCGCRDVMNRSGNSTMVEMDP